MSDTVYSVSGPRSPPDLAQSTHNLRLADEIGFHGGWLHNVPTFDSVDDDSSKIFDLSLI